TRRPRPGAPARSPRDCVGTRLRRPTGGGSRASSTATARWRARPATSTRTASRTATSCSPGPSEVIVARALAVQRSGRTVVDGLDLYLMRGDELALVGPNGIGKTTLLEVLRRVREPDAGSVRHGVGLGLSVTEQVD